TAVTRSIIAKEEMKGMDMIIGPLFPEPMRIVNEFSHQYKITLINPLTNSPEFIRSNPYHYLYNPSVLTIGEVMADHAFEKYGNKPGIVIYGETLNDQLTAQSYADRYIENGGTLSLIREIGKDESEEVLEILLSSQSIKDASTEEGRENMDIAPDSIGHIFVASNNSLIFSKIIGAVDTRSDAIKVFGSADWLESPVVKYEVFNRLDVSFYAPNYIRKDKPVYMDFRRKYMRRHREIPSKYAQAGYDLAIFIGQSLDRYGNYPPRFFISGNSG
ncbi:MAG: ABC transporter substrate-binding protein, partial [Cyclobacteriaceae bacterium]